ncbi:META domain-containing protein [Gordonia sp. X0973]|uniref:META domain-containing protein n=1 Tax=Gordonia sp. X0973 TaxID=2742602 RepID=UPI000F52EDE8|nr:META domain-containing protein [Gordonia sp. X0973]QKT07394.1 META domain-containing protein [Gordonia sp. X0973]
MNAHSSTGAAALLAAAALGSLLVTAPAQAVPGLSGRAFTSTSVSPGAIPGGGPLKIRFLDKDRVGLTAGCNQMTGIATAQGGRLHFTRLASTMMMCPPPRDKADAWVQAFTAKAPNYQLTGKTLTLRTPTTTVVLTEVQAAR